MLTLRNTYANITTRKSVFSDDSKSSLKAHKPSIINISDDWLSLPVVANYSSVKTKLRQPCMSSLLILTSDDICRH